MWSAVDWDAVSIGAGLLALCVWLIFVLLAFAAEQGHESRR